MEGIRRHFLDYGDEKGMVQRASFFQIPLRFRTRRTFVSLGIENILLCPGQPPVEADEERSGGAILHFHQPISHNRGCAGRGHQQQRRSHCSRARPLSKIPPHPGHCAAGRGGFIGPASSPRWAAKRRADPPPAASWPPRGRGGAPLAKVVAQPTARSHSAPDHAGPVASDPAQAVRSPSARSARR